MASGGDGLAVRRSTRHEISLPVRIAIAEEHKPKLSFGSGSGHRDGWIEGVGLDLATGGTGVATEVFLPRGVQVLVRFYGPMDDETPLAECRAKVMRVFMTDARPGYQLGLAFQAQDVSGTEQIDGLLQRLEADAA